jgi:tungstate transport system substrate-binding protein
MLIFMAKLRFQLLSLCLIGLLLCGCAESDPNKSPLRLATTTTTRDSGLLDVIIPPFERNSGVHVELIAVGTGKALKLGEAGDVDAVLVHSRTAEDAFLAAGDAVRREDVMFNHFQLVGPPGDPAAIRDLEPTAALAKIAEAGMCFVSRGDESGTHWCELKLWAKQGERPEWPQYVETGQGMGATLTIADQMRGYTLSDRGTYLNFREKVELVPLAADSPEMRNPYGALVVNPQRHPGINVRAAEAFVDYLILPETQKMIADYQIHGESLFTPHHLTAAE